MNVPTCDAFRTRFDDYHDGLLSPADAETVQTHLKACAGCQEEYRLLVSCIGLIRGFEAPSVPPQTLRRIVDTLPALPDPSLGPDFEGGLETT
jgi:hypothetical protein